jgi:hypothetical protein
MAHGEGVEVLHFERMSYPLYAKVRSIGGVVVLAPRWTPMV